MYFAKYILNMSWGYSPTISEFLGVIVLTMFIEITTFYFLFEVKEGTKRRDTLIPLIIGNLISGLAGILLLVTWGGY